MYDEMTNSDLICAAHDNFLGAPPEKRFLVEELVRRVQKYEKTAIQVEDIHRLIDESEGVYGWHLNGTLAPWPEVLPWAVDN